MSDSERVYNTEQTGDVLIVSPAGEQIGYKLARIQKDSEEIAGRIDGDAIRHVLYDAGNANYISSTVIGSMIQMWEATGEHGGHFAICNLSEAALEALIAVRLDTKWPRYDSREDGLAALRAG